MKGKLVGCLFAAGESTLHPAVLGRAVLACKKYSSVILRLLQLVCKQSFLSRQIKGKGTTVKGLSIPVNSLMTLNKGVKKASGKAVYLLHILTYGFISQELIHSAKTGRVPGQIIRSR